MTDRGETPQVPEDAQLIVRGGRVMGLADRQPIDDETVEHYIPISRVKEKLQEVEVALDGFIESNSLRSQDCGDVVPVTSLESFAERLLASFPDTPEDQGDGDG